MQSSNDIIGLSAQSAQSHYHPDFADSDADVVLVPKDGVVSFRVHSSMLRTTSGFFRTMLSLHDPHTAEPSLDLEESHKTLEALLRMMSGLPVPNITTFDAVDDLVDTMEKYDTPGPLSVVRLLVMSPAFEQDPFRLFSIACRFGWDAEARYASTLSLSCNIYAPESRPALQRCSSEALLRLMDLHRSRREG